MPSRTKHYWLLKTEPSEFSIDDLLASPNQTTFWFGVRNYQARNLLRDDLKLGDEALFYHSSCAEPAVMATCTVMREAYPDHTALDKTSPYFDPKSTADNPRWFMVDVKLKKQLKQPVTITQMRQLAALAELPLLRKGNRLSVQPVTKEQFEFIVKMSGK